MLHFNFVLLYTLRIDNHSHSFIYVRSFLWLKFTYWIYFVPKSEQRLNNYQYIVRIYTKISPKIFRRLPTLKRVFIFKINRFWYHTHYNCWFSKCTTWISGSFFTIYVNYAIFHFIKDTINLKETMEPKRNNGDNVVTVSTRLNARSSRDHHGNRYTIWSTQTNCNSISNYIYARV